MEFKGCGRIRMATQEGSGSAVPVAISFRELAGLWQEIESLKKAKWEMTYSLESKDLYIHFLENKVGNFERHCSDLKERLRLIYERFAFDERAIRNIEPHVEEEAAEEIPLEPLAGGIQPEHPNAHELEQNHLIQPIVQEVPAVAEPLAANMEQALPEAAVNDDDDAQNEAQGDPQIIMPILGERPRSRRRRAQHRRNRRDIIQNARANVVGNIEDQAEMEVENFEQNVPIRMVIENEQPAMEDRNRMIGFHQFGRRYVRVREHQRQLARARLFRQNVQLAMEIFVDSGIESGVDDQL